MRIAIARMVLRDLHHVVGSIGNSILMQMGNDAHLKYDAVVGLIGFVSLCSVFSWGWCHIDVGQGITCANLSMLLLAVKL